MYTFICALFHLHVVLNVLWNNSQHDTNIVAASLAYTQKPEV